jgi:hypothetical protein
MNGGVADMQWECGSHSTATSSAWRVMMMMSVVQNSSRARRQLPIPVPQVLQAVEDAHDGLDCSDALTACQRGGGGAGLGLCGAAHAGDCPTC